MSLTYLVDDPVAHGLGEGAGEGSEEEQEAGGQGLHGKSSLYHPHPEMIIWNKIIAICLLETNESNESNYPSVGDSNLIFR